LNEQQDVLSDFAIVSFHCVTAVHSELPRDVEERRFEIPLFQQPSSHSSLSSRGRHHRVPLYSATLLDSRSEGTVVLLLPDKRIAAVGWKRKSGGSDGAEGHLAVVAQCEYRRKVLFVSIPFLPP
jgi:hypothetical protein